jgi:hypothetical protein
MGAKGLRGRLRWGRGGEGEGEGEGEEGGKAMGGGGARLYIS